MKTQSRTFRTSDWVEDLPSNRTINPYQVSIIDNSVNVLEWPSHSLGLNAIKYFWRNLKMYIFPHPTWQSLRHEDMRRRMANNCQILMCKACLIIPKTLEAVKVLQISTELRVWRLMQCTYFSFFLLINLWSCDNSVFALSLWCIECRLMWNKIIQSRLT